MLAEVRAHYQIQELNRRKNRLSARKKKNGRAQSLNVEKKDIGNKLAGEAPFFSGVGGAEPTRKRERWKNYSRGSMLKWGNRGPI